MSNTIYRMKKNVLLAAAMLTASFGLQAQTVATADEYLNALANGAGDVVITIPSGTNIDVTSDAITSIAVNAAVTSITVQGEGETSVLTTKGAYDLSGVAELGAFRFKNLKVTRGDENGDYALTVKTSIKEILFDGCVLTESRGVVRVRENESIAIGSLTVNNCLVSKIGSYSLLAFEVGKLGTLTLTNNTFFNFSTASQAKNLVTFKPAATGETDVRLTNFCMENNTLNKVVLGGTSAANYVVDFGKVGGSAVPVAGSFSFQNNLLGEPLSGITKIFSKVPQSTDENYEFYTKKGNFISSSWQVDTNSDKYFTDNEVKNEAPAVAELFKDAANGDFTLAAGQAYSQAGDPRWRTADDNGIEANVAGKAIVSTACFTAAGVEVSAPVKGLNILRHTLEDGTVQVEKRYIR